MKLTPSRSYLITALHQWMTDNDLTPHLAVDARVQGVMVPQQFARDEQLVLNISYSAVQNLQVDQAGVSFNARFGGVPMNVFIPLVAVLAIYARENGQGMGFGMEPGVDMLLQAAEEELEAPTLKSVESAPKIEQSADKESAVKKPKKGQASLKVIK